MTLFITTRTRHYEISEVYVMALTFILTVLVTKIVKDALQKLKNKGKDKIIKVADPRGGSFEVDVRDQEELGYIILSCIADNQQYIVINETMKKLIFKLVKAKLNNESLTLTPNMMRFLALKLLSNDKALVLRIGSAVISSESRSRIIARIIGAALFGLVGTVFSLIPYAVLASIFYFDITANCGYICSNHFQQLPEDTQETILRVYSDRPNQLVIAGNDEARQVAIYTPSPETSETVTTDRSTGDKIVKKTYKSTPQKARQVNFSDFKRTDPVLSSFKNLEEPSVPQNTCPLEDFQDVAGFGID